MYTNNVLARQMSEWSNKEREEVPFSIVAGNAWGDNDGESKDKSASLQITSRFATEMSAKQSLGPPRPVVMVLNCEYFKLYNRYDLPTTLGNRIEIAIVVPVLHSTVG